MRGFFIVLMIMMALAITAVAALNNEIVTVYYIFGQIDLTLFAVILGSTLVGIFIMIFFDIYRSIHNYIKSESERNLEKDLQNRNKLLEDEKKKLEDELEKLHKEREIAAAKEHSELAAEKERLEEELKRQRQESEYAKKEQAGLALEKEKLEEDLRWQQKDSGSLETQVDSAEQPKKGFWDFLNRK
jgi:uncharacterized integral membrane protein